MFELLTPLIMMLPMEAIKYYRRVVPGVFAQNRSDCEEVLLVQEVVPSRGVLEHLPNAPQKN